MSFFGWMRGRFASDTGPLPAWFFPAFLLVMAFRLWLSAGQTVAANGDSGYDDRLFLTLARNLLESGWLGRFNHLTLIKGPFYPAWVAAVFLLGIPLLFSHQLLYAFACMVFTLAVRPLVKRPIVLLMIFTVLIFNPMSYSDQVMDRPFREGIYPALTLLVLGSAAGLLTRREFGLKKLLPWSAGLGLSLSAFYLTREEGVLIMPSVLLIISFTAVSMLIARHGERVRALLICVLPFCIWLASIAAVSEVNKIYYGVFTTAELKSPAFLSAYGALTRVKHEKWHPFVPVPRDVRERVYKVSPAFAELRPFLEGGLGKAWTVNSCLYLSVCDDVTGGWFVWLFREAVVAAGHYESAKTARDYYRSVAVEVNGACRDGRLECGPERASLSPVWDNRYLRPLLGAFRNGVVGLARFDGFLAASAPTVGAEEFLDIFRDMTGGRLSSDVLFRQRLVGWAFSPDSPMEISVHDKEGDTIVEGVKFSDSPDVFDHFMKEGKSFPNARKARFSITAHCAGGCYLYIKKGGAIVERTRFEDLRSGWAPDRYLTIDSMNNGFPVQTKLRVMKERLSTEMARVYQRVAPALSILALAAYLAETLLSIKNREITAPYVISTALIMAVVIRLLVLAMIEVSSFPAMYKVYMSSAYPLLLMSIALVFIDGRRLISRKSESKKV